LANLESRPALNLVGLDHVVLRCRDADRMIRFYCDVIGCTLEQRSTKSGLIHLRAGRSQIDLISGETALGGMDCTPPFREGRNLDHFALRIEWFDTDMLRTHLAAHGVDMGVVKSRHGAEGKGPSVYIEDPEGNVVELKGPPSSDPVEQSLPPRGNAHE
jgi:catechol 2,3-dioxygenase-like lactoylglutathione lyase family enzyme